MDMVHLIGAEQVKNAGHNMQAAATDMQNAASWMIEAFQQHQRFLDDWLARFEAVLEDKQKCDHRWEDIGGANGLPDDAERCLRCSTLRRQGESEDKQKDEPTSGGRGEGGS